MFPLFLIQQRQVTHHGLTFVQSGDRHMDLTVQNCDKRSVSITCWFFFLNDVNNSRFLFVTNRGDETFTHHFVPYFDLHGFYFVCVFQLKIHLKENTTHHRLSPSQLLSGYSFIQQPRLDHNFVEVSLIFLIKKWTIFYYHNTCAIIAI